jgi:hypothetical protein
MFDQILSRVDVYILGRKQIFAPEQIYSRLTATIIQTAFRQDTYK